MKLTRILVRELRGVAEREVHLDGRGVTVIEGPNEVGKSSLADAVDVLFDEPHTTAKQYVQALQPRGRDVGTTIEVDAEFGTYRVTYTKTFNREKRCVLTIHAPRSEVVTGREAHDRMEQLLAESLDVDLWRALRVTQGQAHLQADLRKSTSLVEALDRAAGTAAASGTEETLFAAVRAEYDRYFTPTGRDGTDLRDAEAAVAARREDVRDREDAVGAIERDVDRHEALDRQVVDLTGELAVATERAEQREAAWTDAQRRLAVLGDLVRDLDLAVAARDELLGRDARRAATIAELAALDELLAEHHQERVDAEAGRGEVEAAADRSAQALAAARADLVTAETALEGAERAVELAHAVTRLARLRDDLAAVDEAQAQLAIAERDLAALALDEDELAALRSLEREVAVTAAAAEAAAPRLMIEALTPLHLDGRPLAAADVHEQVVTGSLELTIDDVATVRVIGGAQATERATARTAAHDALDAALASSGVGSVDEAADAVARRTLASQARDRATTRLELMGDPETLRVELQACAAIVSPGEADELPADDVEAAERRRVEARTVVTSTRRVLDAASEEYAATCAALAAAVARLERLDDRLTVHADRRSTVAAALAADRAELDDDALGVRIAAAQDGVSSAAELLERERDATAAEDLDTIRLLADNARSVASDTAVALRAAEDERREVAARLGVVGEEGRFERLEEARVELAHRERDHTRLRRRAAAARRLYETMAGCRDDARRAYLQPLRERIESLARVALGQDVEIELDEDTLAVARIVRDGIALEFEELSVGAQEQLAVVQRLATAMLVAPDGGVPLVLDDALGFSDPERLERMGAVLRVAGEQCQVLVLTCVPQRYRHVGAAQLLHL